MIVESCRHYDYDRRARKPICKEGRPQEGKPGELPCFKSNKNKVGCECRSWYTPEEIARAAKEYKHYMRTWSSAVTTIYALKPATNTIGEITCPKCKGTLRYRVHGNGRIWGHCETEKCLQIM